MRIESSHSDPIKLSIAAPSRARKHILALLALIACEPPPTQPPDILLITLDTVRADALGAYGRHPSPTPGIDALSRRGARFSGAMTTTPLTLPAHASLMTGRYPDAHGLRDNGEGALSPEAVTLAERLQQAGYRTGAFVGAIVLDAAFGLDQGFETYEDGFDLTGGAMPGDAVVSWPAEDVLDRAARWLAEDDGRPTLTWIHLYDAHAPYQPPSPFDNDLYLGEIAALDAALAPWLAPRPNTIIAVAADHGESRGEHGEMTHGLFVYRSTMAIPLLLSGPGVPEGATIDGAVSLTDLAPTLLALVGAEPLPEADGVSLLPALAGTPIPPERLAYGESFYGRRQYGLSELRVLADGRHRYIRAPRPELYDQQADPDELHDLSDPAATAAWEERLSALLGRGGGPLDSEPAIGGATRAALAALGYLSEPSLIDAATPHSDLPDPKDHPDMVAEFEALVVAARTRPPADAVPILEAYLRANPAVSTGWLLLSMARELSGDPEGALDALAPLRAARPDDPILSVRAAGLLLAAGRLDEAQAAATSAQSTGPSAAMAAGVQAEILRQQGDCDAAGRAVTAALTTAPESSSLRRVRGICRFDAGDVVGARADLQAAAAADPTDTGARYLLGALAAMAGELEAAEAQLRSLPEPLRSEALGRLRYQQGRYAEAIELLATDRSAEARLLLADATLREEGPSEAVRAMLDAVAAELPGDGRVHRIRSALLVAEGDVPAALTEMAAARGSEGSAVHWR